MAVRIAAVQREGPVWQVTTPGQLVAGQLARVEVADTTGQAAIAGVDVAVPETGVVTALTARSGAFRGTFTPPAQGPSQPLRVQIRLANGDMVVLHHGYRLRQAGAGVVQRLRLGVRDFASLNGLVLPVRAVAVGSDGTAWLATDGGAFRILPYGGLVQGVVQDPQGLALAGVEVTGLATPFRAVTDATGRFVMA